MDQHDLPLDYDWPFDANEFTMFDDAILPEPWDYPAGLFETTSEPIGHTLAELSEPQGQSPACDDLGQPAAKRRKLKAPTLRDSDWEPYKDRILELYSQPKMSIQLLQRILWDEENFYAEIRQYHTVIQKWKANKNIKTCEMAAIVRKRQQRKLIDVNKGPLDFSVRGKPVEPERIRRWMRSRRITDEDLYDPDTSEETPSDVDCWTVCDHSSPVQSPATFDSEVWTSAILTKQSEAPKTTISGPSEAIWQNKKAAYKRIGNVIFAVVLTEDEANSVDPMDRSPVYYAILSANNMEDEEEVARLDESLLYIVRTASLWLSELQNARHTLKPMLNLTDPELCSYIINALRNMMYQLHIIHERISDIEQQFLEAYDLRVCLCSVVRRLQSEEVWLHDMGLEAIEMLNTEPVKWAKWP